MELLFTRHENLAEHPVTQATQGMKACGVVGKLHCEALTVVC